MIGIFVDIWTLQQYARKHATHVNTLQFALEGGKERGKLTTC
jgi:hypothetical protein